MMMMIMKAFVVKSMNDGNIIVVVITLDDHDDMIRWGMSACEEFFVAFDVVIVFIFSNTMSKTCIAVDTTYQYLSDPSPIIGNACH